MCETHTDIFDIITSLRDLPREGWLVSDGVIRFSTRYYSLERVQRHFAEHNLTDAVTITPAEAPWESITVEVRGE